MQYNKGEHCTFHHRYHLVWITKYRYKVRVGDVRFRVTDIIRQACVENRIEILKGASDRNHAHMFISLPLSLSICDFMRDA